LYASRTRSGREAQAYGVRRLPAPVEKRGIYEEAVMSSPVIKVRDVCYVTYQHPDLDKAEAFLVDFGLVRSARTEDALYMRGGSSAHHIYVAKRGTSSKFLGLAFEADTRSDLEALCSHPGATPIQAIAGPGGGERVGVADPDGFQIDVVYGIQELPELEIRRPLVLNYGTSKHRLGKRQILSREPPRVLRLGHVGLGVVSYEKSFEFYSRVLGMIASDDLYDREPGNRVGGFLRCDRGENWTDHHTIALFQHPKRAFIHHASFELQDFDAVMFGHEWLEAKGWRSYWGVGRHVLGSQVFDYWRDPFGNMIEHYADGDVCSASTSAGSHQRSADLRKYWGPPVPADFMEHD